MSFGLYRDSMRQRKRRRVIVAVLKFAFGVAAVAGSAYYGFQVGIGSSEQEVAQLRGQIATLNDSLDELKQTNDRLRAAEMAANLRESQWQERYARDVPKGEIVELIKLAREKQKEGVGADRLAFVIKAAQQKRDCDNSPLTKRFVVKTPVYRGANDWVAYGDNLITVTAEGQSVMSADGKPEAWFDPAKPVTVTFNRIGGDPSVAEGMLPLYHSGVVSDVEYRFTMTVGDRGFINVSGDRCRYP